MADPLSIAASIAGLISVADVVFTRLVKYGKAVKNAEKELKELTKDVNLLGGSLDSLSRLARALEDGSFKKNLHMDYIDDCNETLEEMKEKLGKVEADSAKGKLFWPGRSSRLKTWHEDISRHQRLINAALSADTLHALLQILSREDQQREEILSEIRDTRSIVSRVDKDSRRSKVEAFFLKCNPQENYEMSLQLRHPRTGLWLINRLPQFQHWLSASKSMLWLKGIPGGGKTVLAGSIIEAALGKSTCTDSIATAFFFCDYKDPVTQSPETILGVLAYQLSIQSEDAYELLVQYYDGLHPKQALPRAPDISSLKVLLQKVLGMYDHVYLILDGLDECGNMTEDVVDVLVGTFDEADNVSAALLSRDEDGIRDRLSDCYVSIEVAAHKHDIMEYVTAQIQERIRVGKLSAYDPELKAEIIQGLVDGAKGMFRWVSCQLDHLKDCVSDQDCRDALLALPPTLDESYARILKRVPKGKRRLVQLALQFIAYASPKLTIRQLREALSVPERGTLLEPRQIIHLNAVTKYCSSLVRESSDGQYLEFSHFSVQEFLKTISSQDPDLVDFGISESLSHRLLAVECLRFLQLRNFFRPHFDPETEQEKIDNRQVEFPFYSYAAGHWPRYARHAWDDAQVVGLAKSLFHPNKSPYFTSWSIALAYAIGDIRIDVVTANLASPSFTPLHMASALSLEGISSFLIEQGANVNMESEAGCPLQCAVQGLLFMSAYRDKFRIQLADIVRWYHGTMATEDTIKCLYRAGASLDTTLTQVYPGEDLLEVSFRSVPLTGRLSVPTVLIQLGIKIQKRSLKRAEKMFQISNAPYQHEESYTAGLQPFIESLDQRADRSATVLRMCSLAWEAALYAKLEFTFNVLAIDTQVTLTVSELEAQAIAATRACNVQVLQKIMSDPRFEAANIADNEGDSLLHLALYRFRRNIEKNLEMITLLTSARCDILKPNKYGFQPLHVWDWELVGTKVIWPTDTDPEPFRNLMQILTEMGADCTHQCSQGRNALHNQIFSSLHFRAILDTQNVENIKAALEAVDNDGFTPLALMLRHGALQSFSMLVERVTVTPAMMASPVPILSLAVNADADDVLDFLIPLTRISDFGPHDSPLHHVGPGATARNIRRLKSLYPAACVCRLHGKTPFEAYLERCLKEGAIADVDQDVMAELSAFDLDGADASESSKVWERFAQYAMASKSEEIVASAGISLLKLGYMSVFERQIGISGIIPILSSFKDVQTTLDLQPFPTRLICKILRQTQKKTNLGEQPHLSRLLCAAARSLDFELARLLLNQGVSVQRRVHGISVLESYCESPPDISVTTKSKEMFDLLLEHTEKRQLNDFDPRGNGSAALHLLSQPGAEWMVEKLVRRGADPNLLPKNGFNNTALMHHLLHSRPSYALSLLRNGADPNIEDSFGWDAVIAAASGGFVLVLAEILASDNTKSPPRIKWDKSCPISVLICNDEPDGPALSHDEYNGLHAAAESGHIDIVKFYLNNSLIRNIDVKTSRGWTPLHFAAYRGYLGVIKALCDHGANVNAQCKIGQSPLHLAAMKARPEVAKALVEAGGKPFADFSGCKPSFYADVSTNQQLNEWLLSIEKRETDEIPSNDTVGSEATSRPALSTICATAISENDIPKLQLLAAKAFDFESPLSICQGCSGFIYALKLGRVDTIRWFLQRGDVIARPVYCGIEGQTGLHLALEKAALAQVIPDCLANFTINGGQLLGNLTSLIAAAIEGDNVDGLRHLLTYLMRTNGPNRKQQKFSEDPPNILAAALVEYDNQGTTPLIYAIQCRRPAAIEMLLNFGADINGAERSSLNTPLHEAVLLGDVDIISMLIKERPDLELRNENGQTPLLVAAEQETFTIINILLGAGADKTVLDHRNQSFLDLLPYVSRQSCNTFAESVRAGVDPHKPTLRGMSAFHLATERPAFASYILNSEFHLDDSVPFNWDFFGDVPVWISAAYPLYRKKYQVEALQTFANMTPPVHWSPLCRFACREEVKAMENLLDLKCSLNYEGCPLGSALMAACADGRMASVKFLVRRGASLTYHGPNGYRSAYVAATNQKQIQSWLLVGRFVDQGKLTGPCDSPDTRRGYQPFTWGGPTKAEVVISGEMERWPEESSLAYWSRLMKEKVHWRGRVPPLAPERRTIRPSNLIPDEKIRIHSDGPRIQQRQWNGDSTEGDESNVRCQGTPRVVFDGLLWYIAWTA